MSKPPTKGRLCPSEILSFLNSTTSSSSSSALSSAIKYIEIPTVKTSILTGAEAGGDDDNKQTQAKVKAKAKVNPILPASSSHLLSADLSADLAITPEAFKLLSNLHACYVMKLGQESGVLAEKESERKAKEPPAANAKGKKRKGKGKDKDDEDETEVDDEKEKQVKETSKIVSVTNEDVVAILRSDEFKNLPSHSNPDTILSELSTLSSSSSTSLSTAKAIPRELTNSEILKKEKQKFTKHFKSLTQKETDELIIEQEKLLVESMRRKEVALGLDEGRGEKVVVIKR